MSEPSIESLAERLANALKEIDWMGRKPRPTLRKPATDDDIAAYEADRGVQLPESYKTFLKIHNGMEGAEQYDWVVAGVTPVSKGESFDDARDGHKALYKKEDPNHPAVKGLDTSVVVGTDFDYQIAYFEPATLGDDEPKVRRIAWDMDFDEYPLFDDFTQFLQFVVAIYEDLVDMQSMSMTDDLGREEDMLRELAALLDDAGPSKRSGTRSTSGGAGSAGSSGGSAGGMGGGDDLGGGMEALLGAMFQPEPEPEPEPELSPEMQRAARLCQLVVQKLLDAELLEIIEAPSMRENLEDYLLRKLMRSKSPKDAMESWIYALGKAREVEELYGTDDELMSLMSEAFEEIS
jgi:hypothetical protein